MKVMVIDDDRAYAEELSETLQDAGYEVETFFDGVSALSRMRKVKPAIVLLDFKMADFSGNQLAWYLRTCRDTAMIPIIGMSGYEGNADPVKIAADNSMNAFLKKPFYPLDIITRIEQLTAVTTSETDPVTVIFPRANHADSVMLALL